VDTISPAVQTAVYHSVDELARELGISRALAYAGLRDGTIPSIRLAKRFIIPRAAISDWLRRTGPNA
jgi:excisionase family DNA binding protein